MAWDWGAGWPSMLTPCLLLTWPRGQPRELSHHLFLDYGMIRKSWRAEEANTLSLVLKKKKKKNTTTIVLPMKWIDQLNFPVCKDIILKSHLSIHNHRDCGKGKPFQTNFTSVRDGQWDCNKGQTMDVELEEVHPSLCWLWEPGPRAPQPPPSSASPDPWQVSLTTCQPAASPQAHSRLLCVFRFVSPCSSPQLVFSGFKWQQSGSVVKNLPAMQEYPGSIPGSGKSPGEENGYPLQYSCLENSMARLCSLEGHKELDMTE